MAASKFAIELTSFSVIRVLQSSLENCPAAAAQISASRAAGIVATGVVLDFDRRVRDPEVLRQMAWGWSNKEIAAQFDVSVKTVEVHKANAMRKLGLRGRIDIVRYALLQGWLTDT